METGWNVTAYTCCIETVAGLRWRAGRRRRARKEAEEEASAMEMDVDSRGAKKQQAEIDGDKRGELKERTLHYC